MLVTSKKEAFEDKKMRFEKAERMSKNVQTLLKRVANKDKLAKKKQRQNFGGFLDGKKKQKRIKNEKESSEEEPEPDSEGESEGLSEGESEGEPEDEKMKLLKHQKRKEKEKKKLENGLKAEKTLAIKGPKGSKKKSKKKS